MSVHKNDPKNHLGSVYWSSNETGINAVTRKLAVLLGWIAVSWVVHRFQGIMVIAVPCIGYIFVAYVYAFFMGLNNETGGE